MVELREEIAHVGRLLRAGLGLRGDDLHSLLRRGGRLLPWRVRRAARRLAAAESVLVVPKLAKQLDERGLRRDARLCLQHLTPLVQNRVQHSWLLRAASWAALIALICAALAYGIWRLRAIL